MPTDPIALSREDHARLDHMRKAARDAVTILRDLTVESLAHDMIRTRALINCFTEIGEAAARTTDDARRLAPNVPWGQVVGMRHNLVHVYWGIDMREVVKTVNSDLPDFIAAIDSVLTKDIGATTPKEP